MHSAADATENGLAFASCPIDTQSNGNASHSRCFRKQCADKSAQSHFWLLHTVTNITNR